VNSPSVTNVIDRGKPRPVPRPNHPLHRGLRVPSLGDQPPQGNPGHGGSRALGLTERSAEPASALHRVAYREHGSDQIQQRAAKIVLGDQYHRAVIQADVINGSAGSRAVR
jgi:hypothetical protein